jgi:hypothetical protein
MAGTNLIAAQYAYVGQFVYNEDWSKVKGGFDGTSRVGRLATTLRVKTAKRTRDATQPIN